MRFTAHNIGIAVISSTFQFCKMLKYSVLFLLFGALISCTNGNPSEKQSEEIKLAETQMAEITDIAISSTDSFQLMKSWKNVMQAIENSDIGLLKKYSFDTINCQACKSFPRGTSVEDIPIRRMLPDNFINFYRDSFLFPKMLKYFSTGSYGIDMLAFDKNSIEVHRIRFIDPTSDRWKSSLQFYFVKTGATFRFLGLYL